VQNDGIYCPEQRTLVVFEAPHRLQETLQDIITILGNRRLVVCREMTKIHEEVFRGTAEQARKHFAEPRGEFTLVIEGYTGTDVLSTTSIMEELQVLRTQGVPAAKRRSNWQKSPACRVKNFIKCATTIILRIQTNSRDKTIRNT